MSPEKVCGASLETGARERAARRLSALPRTRLVLVEASKRDPRPVSARRTGLRTVLGRFEARNRPAGSSRAVPRSARWRGVPADPPPGGLGAVARRIACGIFVRCRLARGCAARHRLLRASGSPPSRDADLCLRLLEVGLPTRCCTPVSFKFLPPPLPISLFLELCETPGGGKCSTHKALAATRLQQQLSNPQL